MEAFADPTTYESYAYPSSLHPGGVNMAFCGGQVEFIAETIDPLVYAPIDDFQQQAIEARLRRQRPTAS